MSLCGGNVGTMPVTMEGHSRTGIEEQPVVAVGHIDAGLVTRAPHLQVHVTQLKVDICREPVERAVLAADVGIVLLFESTVEVPEPVRVEFFVGHPVGGLPVRSEHVAPEHLPEVPSVVARPAQPADDVKQIGLPLQVAPEHIVAVVHALVDDEIRSRETCLGIGGETVFLEFLVRLVLVVPAVALREVESRAPAQGVCELVRIVQLEMVLGVVVGLVVVVKR